MTYHYQLAQKQRGLALVVSLIMLILMTLLALNSMQTTVLEEKMAGNYKNRGMAFQAAEAGLRAGEDYLLTPPTVLSFDGATIPGLYQPQAASSGVAIWWQLDWEQPTILRAYGNSAALTPAAGKQLLADVPYYVIEEMPPVKSLETGVTVPASYYRITSRAVGGSDDAVVILQSVYKKL